MSAPIYIADAEGLRAVELEGLSVMFHPRSGMTHILAPPSPQILEVLGEGPADASEILDRIKRHFDVDDGADAISARLAELEAVGLVRRQ